MANRHDSHDSHDSHDDSTLHTTIARALDAIRRGEESEALDHLMPLIESGHGIETAVWELASANAGMLRRPGSVVDGDLPVGVRLCGPDGEDVGIDEVEPALRAAARVLLAFINGHDEDARLQLEIVAGTESPDDMLLVFLHTAGWTLALLDADEEMDARLPSWLNGLSRQY